MFHCRKSSLQTGITLFLFFCCPFFYAQTVNLINYTISDGLSSNQVHCSFQHSDGSMLFGTDVGLLRYDGISFKTIPFTQAQKSNSTIFKIGEGLDKRLYINTYRNGLFFFDGDSIRPYVFNDLLLKICGQSFISNLIITKNSELYFTLFTRVDFRVYRIDANGRQSVTQPEDIYTTHSHNPRKFLFIIDSLCLSKTTGIKGYKNYLPRRNSQIFNKQHKNNTNLKVDNSQFQFLNIPEDQFSYDSKSGQSESSIFHNGYWWVSYNSNLVIFDNKFNVISSYELGFKIQQLIPLNKGSVMVSHQNGATLIKWNNNNFETVPFLSDELISSSFKDSDGGVWLTSTKNGIYYTPSYKIKTFSNPTFSKTDILKIETNPTKIIVSNRKGAHGLYSLPDFHLLYAWDTIRPGSSLFLEQGSLQSTTMRLDFTGKGIKTRKFRMLRSNDIYQYPNSDSILLATPRDGVHLAKVGVEWTFEELKKYDRDLKSYSVHVLDKIIYIGTDIGIQIFSLPNINFTTYLPNRIKTRILDLESIGHKLIASSNDGIFICENDSITHLTTKNGLVSNICRKIEVENDSVFWVANKFGLNKIIYSQKTGNYRILTFTKDDGLNSNSINDLSIEGENIFIATSEGLCYTEIENLKINKSSIPFKVDFPTLQMGNFDFSDTLILEEDKREIYLLIKERSFRHNENLSYSFALNDDDQFISTNNSISYGNLEPGYNSITLNVASANNIWNAKPVILSIWATPYYYEQLWFKISAGFLILFSAILSLIFAIRIREKRRGQKLEMAIANQEAIVSKYNALSLQLSPHFIFNSLNNIQYLSISKNYVAVNQFVANLARLTRKILEHSKLQLISLETEIENLKLFLEIEQIRFEHKPIEIQFEIDPKLDLTNLLIPPMILQPSVENAIWHGLLNKVGSRKLEILFIHQKGGFEIEIRDNGIGLNTKQKGQIKIKGQTSIGVKNTRDRIQLYNAMNMGYAEFSLHELSENDSITGTLASFKFKPTRKI